MNAGYHVIGIDFGTSNSYCCRSAPGKVIHTTPVYFDNGRKTISTSILYDLSEIRGGVPLVRAFGDIAEEEWGQALPSERVHLELHKLFKPDIADSPGAAEDARRFFELLAEHLRSNGLMPAGVNPSDCIVMIGRPADSPPGFDAALKSAARSAFGDVRTVPEPLGALVYHLFAQKDVTPGDARRGIIVVDFGGGTCDIAYLLRLEIIAAWGDASLGGRIFDDLFYQWFVESNPGAEKQLLKDDNEYYVHWVLCREMKERFSVAMNRDRNAQFTYNISVGNKYYGAIEKVTWPEFMARARSFTPSRGLEQVIPDIRRRCPRFSDVPVDLIEWFASILKQGIEKTSVRIEDVSWIILTGGSSSWPFVADILTDCFQIDGKRILRSPDPQATVAEGIALLPVLRDFHERIKGDLRRQKDDKIREINEAVEGVVDTFTQDIMQDGIAYVLGDIVMPVLRDFAVTGGRLNALKARLETDMKRMAPRIQDIINERIPELQGALAHSMVRIIRAWFRENQLPGWNPGIWSVEPSPLNLRTGDGHTVDEPVFKIIYTVTTIVVSYISGHLIGGAGTALIMKGPLGFVLGAVIGVVAATAGLFLGKERIMSWTGELHIPAFLSKRLFTEKKLNVIAGKIKKEIQEKLREYLDTELESMRHKIRLEVEKSVDEQIQNLSILDQIE